MGTMRQSDFSLSAHMPASSEDDASQNLSRDALSQGGHVLAGIPTFSDFEAHRQWIREHMAAAFRSMGRQGLAEGLAGHISVRDPEQIDRFWMNP
jgi:hypothetical protein